MGRAVRRFWCTDRPHERCAWRVEISRGRGGQFPVFKAACTSSGTAFFGITPDVVWSQVLASVSDKRSGRGAGKSISAAESVQRPCPILPLHSPRWFIATKT